MLYRDVMIAACYRCYSFQLKHHIYAVIHLIRSTKSCPITANDVLKNDITGRLRNILIPFSRLCCKTLKKNKENLSQCIDKELKSTKKVRKSTPQNSSRFILSTGDCFSNGGIGKNSLESLINSTAGRRFKFQEFHSIQILKS